jgi:hypothetical protein
MRQIEPPVCPEVWNHTLSGHVHEPAVVGNRDVAPLCIDQPRLPQQLVPEYVVAALGDQPEEAVRRNVSLTIPWPGLHDPRLVGRRIVVVVRQGHSHL